MRSLWSHGLGKMNFRKGHLSSVARPFCSELRRGGKCHKTKRTDHRFMPADTNKNQQTARGNDRIICTERPISQRVPFECLKFRGIQQLKPEFLTPKLMEPKLDTRILTLTFAALSSSWWCSNLSFPSPSGPVPRSLSCTSEAVAPSHLFVMWGIGPAELGAERAGGNGKTPNCSLSSSEMTHIRFLRETLWNWLNLAERGFKTLQPFLLGNKSKWQLIFLLLAEAETAANIWAG